MSISIPSNTLEKFTTFGDLLRFLRRRVGLTQTELAIAVGYGHTQISRLEQNQRLPDISTIESQFIPALGLEDEPKVVARLLDLAANVRREDAPALGLCPYKGLNYFDEADADLFVGREALTAKLVGRVLAMTSTGEPNQNRFLAIVGASGSGKSSLVRAGVVSSLRWNKASTEWHIHVLTPTAHPLEALAATLCRESNSVQEAQQLANGFLQDTHGLHNFVKHKSGLKNGACALLVIDQFEEVFTLCRSEDERACFIGNLLTAASEASGRTAVVLTLRADFYAQCAGYPPLREALAQQQEYIGAMNEDELRRAMEEPALRGRWEFEPGLVDLLLHDVGHEPGALPLLSHALLETWQRRRGRTMTLSGYASSGGVRGAIAETAETVFSDQFTHAQQAIARRIFLRLTELSDETSMADTRRRATFNELVLKPEEAAITHDVLNALADARLIITGENSAEVAHEALIREWPTLRGWLEENRDSLRLHRQLTEAAQEWLEMDREPDVLYRGARLAQAREWAQSHEDELNTLESEFLQTSIVDSERQLAEKESQRQRELDLQKQRAEEQTQTARQLRRLTLFLSSVLIVAGLLAVAAIILGQRAAGAAQLSSSRELAAAAISNLDVDPERSILLALQAVSIKNTQEAEDALHQAILASRVRLTLSGHTDGLTSVSMSPDGKRIATASLDGTVKIWDVATATILLTLHGHKDAIWSVDVSPDGSRLVTAGLDRTAIIWDTASGEPLITLSGHADSITRAVFSPQDGAHIATASDDGTVMIWDAASGKEMLSLPTQSGRINYVSFSPDGQHIATAQDDGITKVWDANNGEELLTLAGHADNVLAVVFSPDGNRIATTCFDGTAKLWDAASGENLLTLTGHHNSAVYSIAFSPDGTRLATSSSDNTAKLWDVTTGMELFTLSGHTGFVLQAAFSSNGKQLVTASADGTARLWDLGPAHELATLVADDDAVDGVAISPDGRYLATAGWKVSIWDMATSQLLYELVGHTGFVHSVKFSPDGLHLVTTSDDETARVWDLSSQREILNLPVGASENIPVAYNPDGEQIATTGVNNSVQIWDVANGKELLSLGDHASPVVQLAFHPDGTQLASASENEVKVWSLIDRQEVFVLREPAPILTVGFSPDGRYIATGHQDGSATIWNATNGKQIFSLFGHTRAVFGLAFSPDGTRLATSSSDGTVGVWDTKQGDELFKLLGHTGRVFNVVISPDGKHLATAGQDGTSRIYVLDLNELMQLARSRVTRSLTEEECQRYLHMQECPSAREPQTE